MNGKISKSTDVWRWDQSVPIFHDDFRTHGLVLQEKLSIQPTCLRIIILDVVDP